jgi:ribosomal protein S18 acetylase RimI-like enzyme
MHDPEQIAPIFDPFEVKDRNGNVVHVICRRHRGSCWRLIFSSSQSEELGDLLFEPTDRSSVKLINFHVFPEYARNGIGTAVLRRFLELLRNNEFRFVNALCVSYERPLAEKERLARWYKSFGFTIVPEGLVEEPGYMGKLNLVL